jgi:asparagine synthase (glutamine-hydrolysing)
LIAGEVSKGCPPDTTRLEAWSALARWSGTSIWSTFADAISLRRKPVTPPGFPCLLVRKERQGPPPGLAWLEETGDVPPAKQLHILLLAMCWAAFARSWTTETMASIHPLVSQPLVERVLALSALELTRATRDRALIRTAYAHRLPPSLIARQSKGCVSATYGRMLASSLPYLRAYLLDGLLAATGVLDRKAVEQLLDVDILMQHNIYAEIYAAIFMERWARGWTARVPIPMAMRA